MSGGSFTRIQFTPDLLPADIVGTRIYRASSERFDVELGPVFANFVLADEVNRAPAKVQSALLEVMAEHQVSIGGRTFEVPEPFLVLATQNPVEQEGVYPLPEAQRDRFLMKVIVDYPTPAEEVEIVNRMGVEPAGARPGARSGRGPGAPARATKAVYVDRGVVDYAVNLVLATRTPRDYGLPELDRASSSTAPAPGPASAWWPPARALALLRGRRYVLPQDVFDVAPEIFRHRLVLSYEAIAQGLHVDQISPGSSPPCPLPGSPPARTRPIDRPIPSIGQPEPPPSNRRALRWSRSRRRTCRPARRYGSGASCGPPPAAHRDTPPPDAGTGVAGTGRCGNGVPAGSSARAARAAAPSAGGPVGLRAAGPGTPIAASPAASSNPLEATVASESANAAGSCAGPADPPTLPAAEAPRPPDVPHRQADPGESDEQSVGTDQASTGS